MSNIKQLREQITNLVAQQRAILDAANKEERALSSEESNKYDAMDAEYERLNAELEIAKNEARLNEERALKLTQKEEILNKRVSKELGANTSSQLSNDRAYRDAFLEYIKSGETRGTTILSTSPDSQGGYLVPPEYQKRIQDELSKRMILRRLSKTIHTKSTTLITLGKGKPTFTWIDENGAYPQTDLSFGQTSISAYKMGGFIKLSEELLSDSAVNIEEYVLSAMVDAVENLQEDAFLNGDGNKKPTGVLSAQVGVTTAKAKEVTTDELLDLMYLVKSSYRTNAVWLISDSLELVLRKLKDNDGQYIWQPAITADAPNMLFGKPVYTSDFMPSVGANAKAAVFGDFNYYTIADRGSYELLRLNEVFALNGQIGFRASARVDAKIMDENAFRVLKCHA